MNKRKTKVKDAQLKHVNRAHGNEFNLDAYEIDSYELLITTYKDKPEIKVVVRNTGDKLTPSIYYKNNEFTPSITTVGTSNLSEVLKYADNLKNAVEVCKVLNQSKNKFKYENSTKDSMKDSLSEIPKVGKLYRYNNKPVVYLGDSKDGLKFADTENSIVYTCTAKDINKYFTKY